MSEVLDNIINQVRDYLDRNDWHYDFRADGDGVIEMGVNIDNRLSSLGILILFNKNGYTSLARCRIRADEASRTETMRYITMANAGMRNGNFEMDVRDGEVRFKSYVSFKGMQQLSEDIIEESVVIPPMMFKRYGDGLAAIMMGFSDADTEIEKAEGR